VERKCAIQSEKKRGRCVIFRGGKKGEGGVWGRDSELGSGQVGRGEKDDVRRSGGGGGQLVPRKGAIHYQNRAGSGGTANERNRDAVMRKYLFKKKKRFLIGFCKEKERMIVRSSRPWGVGPGGLVTAEGGEVSCALFQKIANYFVYQRKEKQFFRCGETFSCTNCKGKTPADLRGGKAGALDPE